MKFLLICVVVIVTQRAMEAYRHDFKYGHIAHPAPSKTVNAI
jgi:hypothetical protein